ncbi:CFEM domain protein [Colletotrichum tabaci]|uniref:CFEM domain protein n=1 Tax=Colletotrichum tabaci TaxID=1209068 RepID=A0AAV9TLY5_9PEZI
MILSSLASAALWLAMMPREAGASAVHLGKRGETPQANVLANTIKSCSYWYDNYEGESCVVVRDYMFAISPETFSRWNPSVGLDCSGWEDWTSYCIQVASEEPPKTTTTTASTTTTVPAQSQTPTAVLTGWNPMGCFIDDHTLATQSTKAGGSSLTVDKCQAACWSEGFRYAGVKSGTECWCGSFVGGDWAADQTSCNVPCPGDAKQTCGGKALLLVFEAQHVKQILVRLAHFVNVDNIEHCTSSHLLSPSLRANMFLERDQHILIPWMLHPRSGMSVPQCQLRLWHPGLLKCSLWSGRCERSNCIPKQVLRQRTSNCYGWNDNFNFSYKDHFRIFHFRIFHNRDHKPANLRPDMFQQHACAICIIGMRIP